MANSYWTYRYIGPRLQDLYDERPLREAMQRMANTGGDRLHAIIADLTPIKTGNLATSWDRHNARRELHGTSMAYVSRVRDERRLRPVRRARHGHVGTGASQVSDQAEVGRKSCCRGSIRARDAAFTPDRSGTLGAPVPGWWRKARHSFESLVHEILAGDIARMAAEYDTLAVKAQVKLP